jgi:hypothetical protein
MELLAALPAKDSYDRADLKTLLESDFEAGMTLVRLFLDFSKDEFRGALQIAHGKKETGVKSFRADPESFLSALENLGALEKMTATVRTPLTWRDLLIERLKSGRGSAIKGQKRGKMLEDFVEQLVLQVFGEGNYDIRCRFVGASGQSTEKADFAIPSRQDPRILVEAKAYGATGSKLTDILGDMARIVEQKRHDTTLLLVTDGTTWRDRANDLRKLIQMQNLGQIARIYTTKMQVDLADDLVRLKSDHDL